MGNVTIVAPLSQVQVVPGSGPQTGSATESTSIPASLPPGTTLSGSISGRDANGNYLLRTDQGTLSLRSSTPLTYNSDVVIRLEGQNNSNARIISVNGEPFASFAAPDTGNGSDSVTTSLLANSAALQPTDDDSTGTQSVAVSVRAVILSSPSGSNSAALSSGSNVVVRVISPPPETPTTTYDSAGNAHTANVNVNVTSNPAPPVTQAQTVQDETPANVARLISTQPEQLQQNTSEMLTNLPINEQTSPATGAGSPVPAQIAQSPAQIIANALAPVEAQESSTPDPILPQSQTVTALAQSQQTAGAAPSPSNTLLYAAYAKQSGTAPAGQPQNTSGSTVAGAPAPAPADTANAASAAGEEAPPAAPAAQPVAVNAPTPAASSNAAPAPATATLTSNVLEGQVVSNNAQGVVSIQTSYGAMTIKTDNTVVQPALAPGAGVAIELPEPVIPLATLSSLPASLNELASSWSTLSDIVTTLTAANAPASNTLLASLPQMGPEMISTSTTFMATMLQGNARKLLGQDTIDTLNENGRSDLIEKFTGELSNLSSAFTQNAPATDQPPRWQMMLLPFAFQEAIQQIRLYVKKEAPRKDARTKSSEGTRFVVEVDLSELGPMQMDGLIRKGDKNSASLAFDLVIRSRTPFSSEQQGDIGRIYASTAELTGFKGTIAFQVSRDFPVKPQSEMLTQHQSVTA